VNADGQPVQIFDRADALISPDGTQTLYREMDDLWLADLVTGEQRNLTQTPDRAECCAQWNDLESRYSGGEFKRSFFRQFDTQTGPQECRAANAGLLVRIALFGKQLVAGLVRGDK